MTTTATILLGFFLDPSTWPEWIKHVFTLSGLLAWAAVYHDIYADIKQQRGHKCRKWLPWLTQKPPTPP